MKNRNQNIKRQAECFKKWIKDSAPVLEEQQKADREFDSFCKDIGFKCWIDRGSYVMLFGGMTNEEYYQAIAKRA